MSVASAAASGSLARTAQVARPLAAAAALRAIVPAAARRAEGTLPCPPASRRGLPTNDRREVDN